MIQIIIKITKLNISFVKIFLFQHKYLLFNVIVKQTTFQVDKINFDLKDNNCILNFRILWIKNEIMQYKLILFDLFLQFSER